MKNLADIAKGESAAVDKAHAEGIHVAGERFVVTRIDDGNIYARQVRGLPVLNKTQKTKMKPCPDRATSHRDEPASPSPRRSRPSWSHTTARPNRQETPHRPLRRSRTTSLARATKGCGTGR